MNAQKREALLNWLFRLTNEVGNVKNMLCNGGALEGALSGDEWDKVHLLLDLLWSKLRSPVESLAIPEAFLRRQFSPIIEMK